MVPDASLEQLHALERLGRPGAVAIDGELGLLSGLDVNEQVVVFLLRSLPLPVEIRRVVLVDLDLCAARENRMLFGSAAAQQEILHAVKLVYFGGVNVPVEDDQLDVFGVGGNHFVRVSRLADAA